MISERDAKSFVALCLADPKVDMILAIWTAARISIVQNLKDFLIESLIKGLKRVKLFTYDGERREHPSLGNTLASLLPSIPKSEAEILKSYILDVLVTNPDYNKAQALVVYHLCLLEVLYNDSASSDVKPIISQIEKVGGAEHTSFYIRSLYKILSGFVNKKLLDGLKRGLDKTSTEEDKNLENGIKVTKIFKTPIEEVTSGEDICSIFKRKVTVRCGARADYMDISKLISQINVLEKNQPILDKINFQSNMNYTMSIPKTDMVKKNRKTERWLMKQVGMKKFYGIGGKFYKRSIRQKRVVHDRVRYISGMASRVNSTRFRLSRGFSTKPAHLLLEDDDDDLDIQDRENKSTSSQQFLFDDPFVRYNLTTKTNERVVDSDIQLAVNDILDTLNNVDTSEELSKKLFTVFNSGLQSAKKKRKEFFENLAAVMSAHDKRQIIMHLISMELLREDPKFQLKQGDADLKLQVQYKLLSGMIQADFNKYLLKVVSYLKLEPIR